MRTGYIDAASALVTLRCHAAPPWALAILLSLAPTESFAEPDYRPRLTTRWLHLEGMEQ